MYSTGCFLVPFGSFMVPHNFVGIISKYPILTSLWFSETFSTFPLVLVRIFYFLNYYIPKNSSWFLFIDFSNHPRYTFHSVLCKKHSSLRTVTVVYEWETTIMLVSAVALVLLCDQLPRFSFHGSDVCSRHVDGVTLKCGSMLVSAPPPLQYANSCKSW